MQRLLFDMLMRMARRETEGAAADDRPHETDIPHVAHPSGEVSVSDVICNSCGNSCSKHFRDSAVRSDTYGLCVDGGHLSDGLLDCTRYAFAICETCLAKLFDAFLIPPRVFEIGTQGDVKDDLTWAEAKRRRQRQDAGAYATDWWRCPTCGTSVGMSSGKENWVTEIRCEHGHTYAVRVHAWEIALDHPAIDRCKHCKTIAAVTRADYFAAGACKAAP